MTDSQYNAWLKTKAKGIRRYLVTNACILGGVYFAFMHLFLDSDRAAFFSAPIEAQVIKTLACFMFGVMAAWTFWLQNKKFEKAYLQKKGESA
ncbi:hypothetical protein MHO82_10000 [Vibrio sp. Of7-15]|uniref:hypothetical protein n=1 Tax=Vibrio sp. Of7-15 TaxID=2724879 RepID=UPI001EF1B510|nr:hypothetical protein [Vibrio sp. Of7-15]MCG7497200.1 hypothetical protein [Vibrio sp. Of7-15]